MRRLEMRAPSVWVAGCILAFIGSTPCFATARVLERAFAVDDTHSYALTVDSSWYKQGQSAQTGYTSADLSFEVTAYNGNNNYDILVTQSNGTKSVNGGTPETIPSGSDTMKQDSGQGKITHQLDMKALLLGSGIDSYGSATDVTGEFSSSAVDVNSTWTQTITYTPYGESPQTIYVSNKLEAWTTLGGYNVGKIKRTYTIPSRIRLSDGSIADGDLSVTEYLWYAYNEKIEVKKQSTQAGTLLVTPAGYASYYLNFTATNTLILD